MSEEDLQRFIEERQTQKRTNREFDRQAFGMFNNKSFTNIASEELELLPLSEDFPRSSEKLPSDDVETTDSRETSVYFDSLETLHVCYEKYDHIDSIVEEVEVNYRRLPEDKNIGNQVELYFCYVIYFLLVIGGFTFAIFYVWLPIIKGILKLRQK